MKKYRFIKMTLNMLNRNYHSSEKYGKSNHRDVIKLMAEEGWSFVGQLPVAIGNCGSVNSYDLVFEKEEEHNT